MFSKLLEFAERVFVGVANLALLSMMMIVTGSVIGRSAFNYPLPDDLLIVGLLMVVVITFPLAYIQRRNGHISVTVISDRLPRRVQIIQSLFGNLLFGLFLGIMGFFVFKKVPREFAQKLYYDGQLEVPTSPMKTMFALGISFFLVSVVAFIWRDIRAWRSGAEAGETETGETETGETETGTAHGKG